MSSCRRLMITWRAVQVASTAVIALCLCPMRLTAGPTPGPNTTVGSTAAACEQTALPSSSGATIQVAIGANTPLYLQFEQPVQNATSVGLTGPIEMSELDSPDAVVLYWSGRRKVAADSVFAIEVVLEDGYRLIVHLRPLNQAVLASSYHCFTHPKTARDARPANTSNDAIGQAVANHNPMHSGEYCYTAISLRTSKRLLAVTCAESQQFCLEKQADDAKKSGYVVTGCSSSQQANEAGVVALWRVRLMNWLQ